MSPAISIIIPSSRTKRVVKTVEALFRQDFDQEDFEIIVVTPEPEKLERAYNPHPVNLRIHPVRRLYPPGKMRNIGAQIALGEAFFFIDDDCLPPPDWLSTMVKSLKSDQIIAAVGCRVVSLKKNYWNRCADFCLFPVYQWNCRTLRDIGSAAMAVKRFAFKTVNGFDQQLLASEDWDFNFKLKNKKWLCLFDPSVEVKHDHRRGSFKHIMRMAFQFGRRSGLTVQKRYRHAKNVSWTVPLMLHFQHPVLYLFMMIPYGTALTVFQLWKLRKTDPRIVFFSPFMLLSRYAYQAGVFTSIIKTG